MTEPLTALPQPRYAVYFSPVAQQDWWEAGCRWLGRDAVTGRLDEPSPVAGIDADNLWRCTAEPRRYGWHATLKAPFVLADGHNLDSLVGSLHALAGTMTSFELPVLRISTVGHFLALRPQGETRQIDAVAAACVTQLHALAKNLTPEDLARRRKANLTPQQDQLLLKWGYPWVLQQFQFHMSLTGPLSPLPMAMRLALIDAAQARFHALPPCRFDRLSLFVQDHDEADFRWVTAVALQN